MHCLTSSMRGRSARSLHSWGKGEGFFFLASIRLMYPWLLYDNLHWTVPSRRLRHGKDQQNYHQHRDSLGIPSSASHGFRPFVPSVTTILQVDTFNSQHVSQYTPHLNYCLIWDNSQHVSQYTPHVKYCLRRSMSRGKQMMCRLHSRHSQWLRMRQSMTNGITLVNLF